MRMKNEKNEREKAMKLWREIKEEGQNMPVHEYMRTTEILNSGLKRAIEFLKTQLLLIKKTRESNEEDEGLKELEARTKRLLYVALREYSKALQRRKEQEEEAWALLQSFGEGE